MKKLFLYALVVPFFAAASLVAHDGHEDGMDMKGMSMDKMHEKDEAKGGQAPAAAQDKAASLKGKFIELGCFAYHGSEDGEHADCAEKCARAGAPLAFKDDASGTFYVVITDGHFVNPAELAFGKIGVPVTVDGVIKKTGTLDTITLKKVEIVKAGSKAKSAKTKDAKAKDEHGH